MIKRLAALAAVGLLAAILAVGAGAARDPFTGAWIGVEDRGDGSTDYMTITGPGNDGARQWLYYETNASGFCSPGGEARFQLGAQPSLRERSCMSRSRRLPVRMGYRARSRFRFPRI